MTFFTTLLISSRKRYEKKLFVGGHSPFLALFNEGKVYTNQPQGKDFMDVPATSP